MSIACSKTVLVPSLYNAEWTIVTNLCLSKVFISPFADSIPASWSCYPAKQQNLLAKLHTWLKHSNPNISTIFYVNLLKDFSSQIPIHFPHLKIAGLVHGCASDPTEPGASNNLALLEKSLTAVSTICVTSRHLLNKLREAKYPLKDAVITGLPLDASVLKPQSIRKEKRLCIFNHRLVKEKGIYDLGYVWHRISTLVPDAKCLVTWPWGDPKCARYVQRLARTLPGLHVAGPLNSNEYNRVAARAVVGFSLAKYENFGTAFAYSLIRRVCYFVPNRLSYPELSPRSLRYNNLDELVQKVTKALLDDEYAQDLIEQGRRVLLEKYELSTFLKNAGISNE